MSQDQQYPCKDCLFMSICYDLCPRASALLLTSGDLVSETTGLCKFCGGLTKIERFNYNNGLVVSKVVCTVCTHKGLLSLIELDDD